MAAVVAALAVAATATVAAVAATAMVGQHCNLLRHSCTRAHCTRSHSSCQRSKKRGSWGRTKAVTAAAAAGAAAAAVSMRWCSCARCSSHPIDRRHPHGGSLKGSQTKGQLTSTRSICLQPQVHQCPPIPVPHTLWCMQDLVWWQLRGSGHNHPVLCLCRVNVEVATEVAAVIRVAAGKAPTRSE